MKLARRKEYVLVISEPLVRWFGKLSTGSDEAKGAAVWPFLFVRGAEWENSWVVRHELIHFRQQFDTLFIGLPILIFLEKLYARFVPKHDRMGRYLYTAAEQEAYLHMFDPHYLETRPFGRIWHYVRHKRPFTLVGPGVMVFADTGEIRRPDAVE